MSSRSSFVADRLIAPDGPPREVAAGKNGAFYNAHSYPTKIPPEAIEPFVEHFTQPGELVLDPFCGSGMTGVAAVGIDRTAILSDLSPGAVHLAFNHVSPCDPAVLREAGRRTLDNVRSADRALYDETCQQCGGEATQIHIVWSATYPCPCGSEINLWEVGFDPEAGRIVEPFGCPTCRRRHTRRQLPQSRHVPTWVTYRCRECRNRGGRLLDADERRALLELRRPARLPVSNRSFGAEREMYIRCALHLQGIKRWSDFYTPRNLRALVALHRSIQREPDDRIRSALLFAFTNTSWHATRLRRFNARGGQRPLTGTLYIPQMSVESNVFTIFEHQVVQAARYYQALDLPPGDSSVRRSSATDLTWLPSASVDYVFTDPPFGSNIFYADCNFVWESWLGEVTDEEAEIVCNRARRREGGGKSLDDYERLLRNAFSEVARVLKPGKWASVVFHSSDDQVWRALQSALQASGLSVQEVSVVDKKQWSMKGYKGRRLAERVTFFDLVLHARKTARPVPRPELNGEGPAFMKRVLTRHLSSPNLRVHPEQRLIQYLHSVVIRELVAGGYAVVNASLDDVEETCRLLFRRRGNRWYVR